jgi:hypothetical protein
LTGATVHRFQDNVMFESDFPNPTSLSPGPVCHTDAPKKVIEQKLSSLSDDALTKILSTNAAGV